MNINPMYKIGQRVKVYDNIISDGKVTNKLSLHTDIVEAIVLMNDIVTKELIYMYKLKNRKYLHNESSLMKCI